MMKNRKNKINEDEATAVKIKVNYKKLYIECMVMACITALFLILPIIMQWYVESELWFEIIWNVFFSFSTIAMCVCAMFRYQTALISTEKIEIRSILGHIKTIYWKDIYDIRIENMIIGNAGVVILYQDWIVIQTNKNQWDPYFKSNRKKKGPWYIAATGKNVDVIKKYMSECRPDILPIEP